MRYWSEEKNEVSVRFLQTLFFGRAKGHDVGMKIEDTLQEVGYQLPLSVFLLTRGLLLLTGLPLVT